MENPVSIDRLLTPQSVSFISTVQLLKKIWLPQVLLPLLLVIAVVSCSDDAIKPSGGENYFFLDPTITHTDIFGNELGGDTSDWCISSSTLFRFNPAYPNPTNDSVNFRFQLPVQDTISLMYQRTNGDTSVFLRDQALNPGVYTVQFSGKQHLLYSGVFRFFIRSKQFPVGSESCRYYGDVQFY